MTYGSCARLHRGKVVAPHARQRAGRGILLLLLLNRLTPAPSRVAGTLGLRLRRRVEAVSAGICASQQASFSVAAYLGVPERVEGALGLAREAGPERVERHTLAQDRAAHTQQARQAQRRNQKNFRGLYLGVLQRALELADSRLEPAALCPLLFHLLLHGLGPAHQR